MVLKIEMSLLVYSSGAKEFPSLEQKKLVEKLNDPDHRLLVECVCRGLFAHFRVSTGWRFGRHVYETGVLHAEPPQPAYKEGRHVHLRNVDGRHIEGIGSPCMPVSLWSMPLEKTLPTH